MKLNEIIEMFAKFGFVEEHIRTALGAGESPFNAFEGLKALLEAKWAEMNQTESINKLKELKPIYERLMKIKLISARTQKDVERERDERIKRMTENLKDQMEEHKQRRTAEFMGHLDKMRDGNPNLDAFLNKLADDTNTRRKN